MARVAVEQLARMAFEPALSLLDLGLNGTGTLAAEVLEVGGPASAFDRILAHGRRGLTISRFKGLGEMNAEELWSTTLDPATRTLLQVKVGDIEEAAQVFSTLMGDVVEPRREFSQANALDAAVDA